MMDELLEILEDIKPSIDFKTCTGLIDEGYLDSFDILSIVSELNDAFEIEISPVDIPHRPSGTWLNVSGIINKGGHDVFSFNELPVVPGRCHSGILCNP